MDAASAGIIKVIEYYFTTIFLYRMSYNLHTFAAFQASLIDIEMRHSDKINFDSSPAGKCIFGPRRYFSIRQISVLQKIPGKVAARFWFQWQCSGAATNRPVSGSRSISLPLSIKERSCFYRSAP